MDSAGNPSPSGIQPAQPTLRVADPASMLARMIRSGGPTALARQVLARYATFLLRLLVVGLSGFHVWLFGARLLEGRLLDPLVALRWLVGFVLLAGLLGLRRLGLPALRGRRAAGLWTLVFLLHCHAVAVPGSGAAAPVSLPAVIEAVVLSVGSALGLGLGLAMARAATVRRPGSDLAWHLTPCPAAGSVSAGHLLTVAPRPPPA